MWKRDLEGAVARSRGALGDEAWQAAYAAGRELTLTELVAELLQTSE